MLLKYTYVGPGVASHSQPSGQQPVVCLATSAKSRNARALSKLQEHELGSLLRKHQQRRGGVACAAGPPSEQIVASTPQPVRFELDAGGQKVGLCVCTI